MKKFCFVFLVLLLLLSGCGPDGNENQGAEKNNNPVINIAEIYETEKDYPAQSYWRYPYTKKMESGYYFVLYSKLYYWDSETESGTICCSASNCSHNSAECSAYFGRYGEQWKYGYQNLDLEIYNNRIYKIGYKMDEVTDFYVYSMNLDGNEREKLGYLYSTQRESDGGVMMIYDWVMIDGYYYGPYSSDEEPVGLYKIRVDGKKTLVLDISDKEDSSLSRVQGIGKSIYFTMEWQEGSEDEESLVYKSNFMRYDTETGKVETLLENSMICEYCFLDAEHIFYTDINGNCYLVDLNTKEETCIIEGEVDGMLSSDGKYLYIDTYPSLCVYTPEGVLVDKIQTSAGQVLFGDENYLFVDAPVEPGQEFTEDEIEVTYLWILDKSQLGTENKQWMKMDLEL